MDHARSAITSAKSKSPSSRSYAALNWLNFFAADVAGGVGPFLAIYLAANRHWLPGPIGIAMSAMSLATVIAQTPAGYLIDRTLHKRGIIIAATATMGIMAIIIPFYPTLALVTTAQVVMGIAGAFYGPTLIALAACLVKPKQFDRTIGQNQTYNHAGNVIAALLIGFTGRYTNNEGVFYCLFVLAIFCALSALAIRPTDLNHDYSKPPTKNAGSGKSGKSSFFRNKAFVLFLASAFIFHFANAAMLPLVGQEISAGKKENASLYMSACIILAQLVMVPVTFWSGKKAIQGRKGLLLNGYLVLPVRGVLYTLSTNAIYLVSVQILDGVAAGIFGVVAILVVNDLARGSGKTSLAQGLLATAVGCGATLSNVVAGYLVQNSGFSIGFMSLSILALVAAAVLWRGMPETVSDNEGKPALRAVHTT
jgi:MFS family permease